MDQIIKIAEFIVACAILGICGLLVLIGLIYLWHGLGISEWLRGDDDRRK